MKGFLKRVLLVIALIIPLTIVKADTKTNKDIVPLLGKELKELNENYSASYDEDSSEIVITLTSKKEESITYEFGFNGTIIEYNPGEIKNYEELENYMSTSYMFMLILQQTLVENGYTNEQINTFFSQEQTINFDDYGFEIVEIGEELSFTKDDTKITSTPTRFKIDVNKANIDGTPTEHNTSMEDVRDSFSKLDNFLIGKDEKDRTIYTNEVSIKDNIFIIKMNNYIYTDTDYWFNSEGESKDIISYESQEELDYDSANYEYGAKEISKIIIKTILKMNGYNEEDINKVLNSINVKFNYEKNSILLEEQGERKEYEGSYPMAPFSFKIDINKANIDNLIFKYEVLEGDNQTFNINGNKSLSFKFNIDYDTFVNEGVVYLDGKPVDKNNYNISKGSTIITFTSDYTNSLSNGSHILLVGVNDGVVETSFTITTNKENPKTGDYILIYVGILLISICGIIYFIRKKK